MNIHAPAPSTTASRHTRRAILRTALCALLCLNATGMANAQSLASPAPADHMILPAALPVESPSGSIEVLELFWYGCPHCNHLEPQLGQWALTLPKDVLLRRVPAILTDSWEPGARLYFTLKTLGQIDRLHQAVFAAEHVEGSLRVTSRDEQKFADWAAKRGVNRTQFLAAWTSAEVNASVEQATALSLPFRRIGVPAMVVDGRFLSTATLAGTPAAMFAAVDRLIAQVRAERRQK